MSESTVAKVTISLSRELLQVADLLARERSTNRSAVIADLLRKEEESRVRDRMAEGYRELAEENRSEAEDALALTHEVVLGDQ